MNEYANNSYCQSVPVYFPTSKQKVMLEVIKMSQKIKQDRSKSVLGSSQVEGQGTTTTETGSIKVPSSNKKQKRS